jgi:hypothetical protein
MGLPSLLDLASEEEQAQGNHDHGGDQELI